MRRIKDEILQNSAKFLRTNGPTLYHKRNLPNLSAKINDNEKKNEYKNNEMKNKVNK